ncbi:arylformamidase [Streptosporangium becharense]|uniref:Carboxylic ester hydrolase n=1 Tax=Streptosporangium becharense TaxID=1816182 RepID=A0A7W9IAD4_9ACTN|nr:carboxylesterase family protein [Streptosporangium becharense]MBB2914056.1 arylformamidase [Streptosporangium becharense]MBB5817083.1 arylformamidase [Streptosporangium becharense]
MPTSVEELVRLAGTLAPPAQDRDRRASVGIWPSEYADYGRMSAQLRAERPHVLDLRYGPDPRHIVDVFLPAERPEPAPVIVFFHGGALEEGHPRRYGFLARPYVDRGAIFVSAGYRLISDEVAEQRRKAEADLGAYVHQVTGEAAQAVAASRLAVAEAGVDAAVDARAAIAWVYHNIAAFGGDPERITVAGHSSGAMVTVAAACADDWQEAHGVPRDVVRTMVPVGGRYGLWLANAIIAGERVDDPPRVWDLRRAPGSVVVFGEEEYDGVEEEDPSRFGDCALIGRGLLGALRELRERRGRGADDIVEVALSPRGHWETLRSLAQEDGPTLRAVLAAMGLAEGGKA